MTGATSASCSWHSSWTPTWQAFAVSRVIVWGAGVAAVTWRGLEDHAAYDPSGATAPFGSAGDLLVAPAARWDARWYLEIADSGYRGAPARAAFFPLYPLLVRALSAVVPSPLVAGAVISACCLVAALLLLHRLTALELGHRAATATSWLVALGPMSLFFSAVYTESLFLLLSVGAVLAARRDHWAAAGGLALLAACTRSAGVLLAVPLVVLAWQSGRRPRLAWALLPVAGPVLFSLHLQAVGLGWRAQFAAQDLWGRGLSAPPVSAWRGARAAAAGLAQVLSTGGGPLEHQNVLFFAALVAAVPCLIGVLRRLPLAYGLYAAAAVALPLSYSVDARPLLSLPRFLAVVFPLWMWLGWWASQERRRLPALCAVSTLALMLFSAAFSTWRFVG